MVAAFRGRPLGSRLRGRAAAGGRSGVGRGGGAKAQMEAHLRGSRRRDADPERGFDGQAAAVRARAEGAFAGGVARHRVRGRRGGRGVSRVQPNDRDRGYPDLRSPRGSFPAEPRARPVQAPARAHVPLQDLCARRSAPRRPDPCRKRRARIERYLEVVVAAVTSAAEVVPTAEIVASPAVVATTLVEIVTTVALA